MTLSALRRGALGSSLDQRKEAFAPGWTLSQAMQAEGCPPAHTHICAVLRCPGSELDSVSPPLLPLPSAGY